MADYLIRVEGEPSSELLSAFPQLNVDVEPVQTVLSGQLVDSAELTGLVNHLDTVGLQIVEIIRLPDRTPEVLDHHGERKPLERGYEGTAR